MRGVESRRREVAMIAVLSRVVTVVLGVLGQVGVEEYDRSTELIYPKLENEYVKRIVGPFSKWDGVYMLGIGDSKQGYAHEQIHAFFPGMGLLMRGMREYVGVGSVLERVLGVDSEIDQLAIIGFICSNCLFVVAACLLYEIYRKSDEKMAYRAASIFSFCACSVFMSAIYTESIFAALSFACILMLENDRFALATGFAMTAALFRSNAMFLAVYFGFIGLRRGRGFAGLVGSLLIVVVVQSYLYWSKGLYCAAGEGKAVADWCSREGIYSYVQRKFWDVGLFGYWQIKNVGFFLLAMPTFAIAWRGVVGEFITVYLMKLRTKNFNNVLNQIIADKRSPYVGYLGVCLVVTLVIANVQIVTRLVSSSPAYFWAAANVFSLGGSKGKWGRRLDGLLMYIHVVYFFIGPLLFCNMLPWT